MDTEFIKFLVFLKSQLPAGMTGVVTLAAFFMYAVKAQWIPLSVEWKNKKIIAPEQAHYVTEEQLMKNCDVRQTALDKKLEAQFRTVFSLLRSIEKKVDDGLKNIAINARDIAVLQERTSHHRKDDTV